MGRLFKYLFFALAFAFAILTANFAFAQTSTPTPSPSPTTNSALTSPLALPAATTVVTVAESAPLTGTTAPASADAQESNADEDIAPLQGTIIANRSQSDARYFLEGQTYQLAVGRSQGIQLPRASTVLNLFNCPGNFETDTAGCFWDPYLVEQDGFYEIYDSPDPTGESKLMLREAGAPPTGQVWVQNRTGETESVVFKDDVFEIEPTSVLEFPVATGVPAILYVRSCLTVDNQSACEWTPKTLDAGVYYAMVEVDTPGTQSGSTLKTIDLRPVVGEGEDAATAEIAGPQPIVCTVVVPALNVRSGPGLQYDIIGKVRSTDPAGATVNVTGRSTDNQWLTVDPAVAENGWINNSPNFITCNGDLATLPLEETPAPPTPQPVVVEEPAADEAASDANTEPEITQPVEEQSAPVDETAEEPVATPTSAAVPAGQALLVVNNGFQHEMRFTLDQRFRVEEGASEFDLQPGQSMTVVVFPGDIAFSASSPWSGLSANATVHLDPDQSQTLWLRFELDTDGSWKFGWN